MLSVKMNKYMIEKCHQAV